MKWHVIKRHILNNWRRRWVRVSLALIVLGVVICGQYFVSRLPQLQDVEEAKYTPAIAKATQQEIVIRGPILSADSNILFNFDGKNHQTVEFRAAKAKLTSDTLSFLQDVVREKYSSPPVGLEEVDYLIKNDRDVVAEHRPASGSNHRSSDQSAEATSSCLTFIAVRAIDNKLPTEIHFYQPEKGDHAFQALAISAIGADLEIQIRQSQPDSKKPEGNPWAAGCKRKLIIGKDWELVNHGEFDLSFIIPANAAFRFDFHALDPTASLRSGSELFEPFVLGKPTLKARALSVIPYEANNFPSLKPLRPHFSVEGAGETGILSINGLREADEEIQFSFSGIGLVKLNGKAVKTLSLFELANQYPIIATICGLANVTLVGWILRNIFARKRA